jgi:hypothetical protein
MFFDPLTLDFDVDLELALLEEAAPDLSYITTALERAELALEGTSETDHLELRRSIAQVRRELPLAAMVLRESRDNLLSSYLELTLINYATTLRQLAFAAAVSP